jgi:hypothetical protein
MLPCSDDRLVAKRYIETEYPIIIHRLHPFSYRRRNISQCIDYCLLVISPGTISEEAETLNKYNIRFKYRGHEVKGQLELVAIS